MPIANEQQTSAAATPVEVLRRMQMARWVLVAAAAIIGYQLFVPPIIGLADQGDFCRVIGKFGYGPQLPVTYYGLVTQTYVRDPNFRLPAWEQTSSEDLFVGAALLLNSIVSKDGALDIRMVGFIHALSLLAALAWLFQAANSCGSPLWIFASILLVATDAAYIAYFNSFFAEPATYIFSVLVFAESIWICGDGVTAARVLRWSCWALMFVLAKPANVPVGVLLCLFAIRLVWRSRAALAGAGAIAAATAYSLMTTPPPMMDVNTYDMVFLAILPESKNAAADSAALGLADGWEKLAGTGAWSTNSGFSDLRRRGIIGKRITPVSVLQFYLERPKRMWRHIRLDLRIATLLRPPLGNFVRGVGYSPGLTSSAFSLWSDFHQYVLGSVSRFLLLALPVPFLVVSVRRIYTRSSRLADEFLALLGICCLLAFLTASFADAWETIKHMLLFNLLLDAWLVALVARGWSTAGERMRYSRRVE